MRGLATISAILFCSGRSAFADERVRPKGRGTTDGPATSIVGGREVTPLERYPYMAVFFRYAKGCGGILIHPRVVLTAAHCLPLPDRVDVGRWNLLSNVPGDAFDSPAVADVLAHPGYREDAADGADWGPDFALALLATASAMAPVALARDAADAPAGALAVVVGFGRIDDDARDVALRGLKEADTRIATDAACAGHAGPLHGPHVLCADEVDGQSCNGDSGGPLVLKDPGGDAAKDVLVGVVSFGPRACRGNYGGYARASWARGWIAATLRDRWGLALDAADAPSAAASAFPSAAPSAAPPRAPKTAKKSKKTKVSKASRAGAPAGRDASPFA